MEPSANDEAAGRYISGATVGALLRHVHRERGSVGVDLLLRRAADERTVEELQDSTGWSTFEQAKALFDAAVEVLGDPGVARVVGEGLVEWADESTSAVLSLLRSLGTPAEVYGRIAETGAKFTSALALRPVEVAEDHALVAGAVRFDLPRLRLVCDFVTGALACVPTVFGQAPAQVAEIACQRRGDPECLWEVQWGTPATTAEASLEVLVDSAAAEVAALRSRLSSLQQTVTELVSPGDPDEVLAAITRRAATAVRATGYVSIIRLPGDPSERVHPWGIYPDELDRLVREIVDGHDDADGSRLVVEVASHERRYGQLVAMLPDGSHFFPQERRLLETYANLAAAALDTTVALDDARRQAATARELLRLSTTLARASTSDEIATRAFSALDALIDCDEPAVLLWDHGYHRLTLRAGREMARPLAVRLATTGVPAHRTAASARLAETTVPLVIRRGSGVPEWDEMLAVADQVAAAVMPIRSGSHFHGFLSVGVTRDPSRLDTPGTMDLIEGVAAHAATALDNAHLLANIRHLAAHDALTGLPNRRLVQDRAEQALADAGRTGEAVGMLFVDLDGFKEVNDAFGHEHGDEVLTQVAERLSGCVRETDTLARLGGDEFAVVLTHLRSASDAERVAAKLLDCVTEPVAVAGDKVQIAASIGVAVGHAGTATYAGLLRAADRAMYRAKEAGGRRVETAPSTLAI